MVCSEYRVGSWRARWGRGIARVIAGTALIVVAAVGGTGRSESLAVSDESSVFDMAVGTDSSSKAEDLSQSADTQAGVGTVGAADSAPDENRGTPTVIYSNTGPIFLLRPEAFRRIADDLRTISTCGCPLNSYEIRVSGGGTGAGAGYSVEVGIYDDCPSFGGQLIPGTEETFVLPDDAEYTLTKTIAPGTVNIPRNIWLGVEFDSNIGGWLVGTQAEIGITFDFFDFPFFPCEATTGIPGRYSGFWARILCDGVGGLAVPVEPSPANAEADVYPIVQLDWNGGAAARTTPGGGESGEPAIWDVDPDWMKNLEPGQWCGTQERYEARGLGGGDDEGRLACELGPCDEAANRDALIPTVDTPFTTYRMYLNVFCRDNGSFCTSSAAEVVAQMATLNADFEPWKIRFEYDFRFVNDTAQRNFAATGDENLMKSTYAVDPDLQCNVYVVSTGGVSWATFPWDSNALGVLGGIVMGDTQFSSTDSTLTHEVGHIVGLWHTHHGVDEVTTCGDCYEFAGSPSDDTGDYCSDTDPTPTNYSCGPPGGTDPCNGTSWGTTDFRNYMGYAGPGCWTNFSAQQAGRLHCWAETTLSSWQVPPECDVLYDVYFNTFSPPTSLLCEGVSSPTCDPGPLNCATTYYWQVVANLGTSGASESGLIWSFDTPTGPDCNSNGTVDACDIAFGGLPDCNSDGIPDDCHADSDGDGVPDPCDICAGGDDTVDGDGDGVPDFCDPCPLDNPDDSDGDGVCNSDDICPGGDDTVDFDGDTVPDFCDPCPLDNPDDTDNDGVCDSNDICPGGDDTVDTDGDTVPDFCDACPLDNPDDTDGDGVCDSNDPCPLDNPDDTDGDSVCDSDDNCELPNADQADCQPNGVGDVCDIAIGGMPDGNGNGVPDECEVFAPGSPLGGDEMSVPGAATWPPTTRATTCGTDADCLQEAVCLPDAAGIFPGTCYVPKNRYLSVAPNPANDTATARRLSVQLGKRECGAGADQGSSCTKNADCEGDCEDMPIACAGDGECAAVASGSVCASTGTCVQVLGWFGAPNATGYVQVVPEANRNYEIWKDGQYPIDCGVDALCPANAFCHTGLGGSNTCKWNADSTQVLWDYVFLGDCEISPMIRDTRPGVEENRAERFYLVESILQTMDILDSNAYSRALVLPTVRVWTDNAGAVSNSILTPPNGVKGFLDILNQVNRFKGKGLAHLAWLDYEPQIPDQDSDFLDMLRGVGGFKDVPYPFDDPCTCAGLAPCN